MNSSVMVSLLLCIVCSLLTTYSWTSQCKVSQVLGAAGILFLKKRFELLPVAVPP